MPEGRTFIDDLAYLERTDRCDRETTLKWLHDMRKDGNNAAHKGLRDTNVAKARLRDAWRLCKQVAREHGIETNVNSFNIDVDPIKLHGQHMSEEMQETYRKKLDAVRNEVNRRQDREVTLKALWPERSNDREEQKQLVEEQVIDYVSKAQVHFSLPTFQTMFQDGAAEIREAAAIHHDQRIEELREAKDLQLHKKDVELRELTKRQL
ncbi:MAG: hypothetical protein MK089_12230, partial [Phycisphaerales bacterium]|nr:hypothetical protein [Phycisphaerales bacterium]